MELRSCRHERVSVKRMGKKGEGLFRDIQTDCVAYNGVVSTQKGSPKGINQELVGKSQKKVQIWQV